MGGGGIGVGEEVGVNVAVGGILVGILVPVGFAMFGAPQDDIMVMPINKIITFNFFMVFSPCYRYQNLDRNPAWLDLTPAPLLQGERKGARYCCGRFILTTV